MVVSAPLRTNTSNIKAELTRLFSLTKVFFSAILPFIFGA